MSQTNFINHAEELICPKGEPWTANDNRSDHGHTLCWIIGGILDMFDEIERLHHVSVDPYKDDTCAECGSDWPCPTNRIIHP